MKEALLNFEKRDKISIHRARGYAGCDSIWEGHLCAAVCMPCVRRSETTKTVKTLKGLGSLHHPHAFAPTPRDHPAPPDIRVSSFCLQSPLSTVEIQ
ncbi:hypothetical protein G6F37_010511 [Rhizopus arrhizus]|nr:hypothetical protein G6F38_008957 [Rhizopus arrhizus]KAG1153266.1 hypothetical protein G6F37_010511 [Rhizopus arrhizus]